MTTTHECSVCGSPTPDQSHICFDCQGGPEGHVIMMKDPDRWPTWPRLPLVKRDGSHAVGFLLNTVLEGAHTDPTVYIGNLFNARLDVETCPCIQYASFEALYDDGWRVD